MEVCAWTSASPDISTRVSPSPEERKGIPGARPLTPFGNYAKSSNILAILSLKDDTGAGADFAFAVAGGGGSAARRQCHDYTSRDRRLDRPRCRGGRETRQGIGSAWREAPSHDADLLPYRRGTADDRG